MQAHKERLLDLSDAELLDLFRTGAAMVQQLGARHFSTMILNQGSARSHAHLHLKVCSGGAAAAGQQQRGSTSLAILALQY